MDLFHRLKNACAETLGPTVRCPEGPSTPLARRRCRFSGYVQGVGFRYQAQRFASQLHLTGWAMNQRDGSVLIEIQGETGCIDEFLQAMQAVPRFDITDIRTEELPLSKTETVFGIRY